LTLTLCALKQTIVNATSVRREFAAQPDFRTVGYAEQKGNHGARKSRALRALNAVSLFALSGSGEDCGR
jgi:hypothetical protein